MQKKKKGKRQKNLPADRKEDISYKNMSANSGQVPNRWAVPRENINKGISGFFLNISKTSL